MDEKKPVDLEELLTEPLADLAHQTWSLWMTYQLSKGRYALDGMEEGGLANAERVWIMPAWAVQRWSRQIATPYELLSEEEKESDRREARKVIAVIQRHLEPILAQQTFPTAKDVQEVLTGFEEIRKDIAELGRAYVAELAKAYLAEVKNKPSLDILEEIVWLVAMASRSGSATSKEFDQWLEEALRATKKEA